MNRVIAILPKIQGKKKGILHMESVATESNTFEEELEQEEVTAENWNGGYDEDGNYTGDGEYDEDGNYVGAKPKTALEEAIENWNGGYDEEGIITEQVSMTNPVIMWDRSYTGISGCGI